MTTVSLDQASRTVESLIVQIRQAEADHAEAIKWLEVMTETANSAQERASRMEQERDEAKKHLQSVVTAWYSSDYPHGLEDELIHAETYLKGGL